ncbi:hypothetical protein KL86DYS2_10537 [uncultured Dysgonomonas sp.]|uniref:Uncharacterized protein n=1 Tax=uncultured Dysgonomonas sp. TaxID=206096 RepID=A0A212J2L7_9BACT|nr:hypothetical protein KL86DYS2_10537 [uncultured Dysgonomonas sp.]
MGDRNVFCCDRNPCEKDAMIKKTIKNRFRIVLLADFIHKYKTISDRIYL